MNRRTLAVTVLIAWLASLGWLLLRDRGTGREEVTGGVPARRLAPEATYYQYRLGETRVGAGTLTLDTTALGYTLLESVVLALDDPDGRPDEYRASHSGTYGRTFRLEAADVAGSDSSGGAPLRLEVLPTGEASLRGGSRDLRARLPLPGPGMTTSHALALQLAARRAVRVGGRDTILVIDAGAATWERGTTVVVRDSFFLVSDSAMRNPAGRWEAMAPESVQVWQVEWTSAQRPPVHLWISEAGRLLAREPAFGLRQDAAPYEVSYRDFPAGAGSVAVGAQGLTGSRWLPRRTDPAPVATSSRVVLRRWDGPAWPGSVASLGGGRQTAQGDTITILPAPVSEPRPVAPPADYVGDLYPGERRFLETMLASALAAAGAASDTIAALVLTASQQRAGDASVRSFVAMAQLAGYLARPVHGIDIRSPGMPGHRWAEVWRGGWQAVDPARGQPNASTTLLRLGTGLLPGLETLVTTFGGLRLTELP